MTDNVRKTLLISYRSIQFPVISLHSSILRGSHFMFASLKNYYSFATHLR